MRKFIACLGFILIPFHISGAMENNVRVREYLLNRVQGPELRQEIVNDNDDMVQDEDVLSCLEHYLIHNRDTGAYAFSCHKGWEPIDRFFTSYFPKLTYLRTIDKIDISYLRGSCSGEVLDCIFDNLGSMPHLSCLWLNECDVMDKHIDVLFSHNGFSIKDLSLRNTPLTRDGLETLYSLCNIYKKITSLGVGGHNANADFFCEMINTMTDVKNLSIQLSTDLKECVRQNPLRSMIQKAFLKNLSIQLSTDLTAHVRRNPSHSMIQEALYRPGFQYDNLHVYFPENTTYKDFFTNNLYFHTKEVDISCSDKTSKFPDNVQIRPIESCVPLIIGTHVDVKCRFHMDVRYKKGDFIGVAKNIMLYAPLKTDCVLHEIFFFYSGAYNITYKGSVYGKMKYMICNKSNTTPVWLCLNAGREAKEYDISYCCSDHVELPIGNFTYKKVIGGRIFADSMLLLPWVSPVDMISGIKDTLMQNPSQSIFNHYFCSTGDM